MTENDAHRPDELDPLDTPTTQLPPPGTASSTNPTPASGPESPVTTGPPSFTEPANLPPDHTVDDLPPHHDGGPSTKDRLNTPQHDHHAGDVPEWPTMPAPDDRGWPVLGGGLSQLTKGIGDFFGLGRSKDVPEDDSDPLASFQTDLDMSSFGPASGASPSVGRESQTGGETCRICGGPIGFDGYCIGCGAKAPTEREHFTETPAAWLAGVCDRGIAHARNEDAMALAADPLPGSWAAMIVCDGVSASAGSDVASLAAARVARDELLAARAQTDSQDPEPRVTRAFTDAILMANQAVVTNSDPDSHNPASCTFVGALVDQNTVWVSNVGDSRAYWFDDAGVAQMLTLDDSIAQERIADGAERGFAESAFGAHTITRWLGVDATDLDPRVTRLDPAADGWLLVCSDGLWNYASEPTALAAVLREQLRQAASPPQPLQIARGLVRWANQQGGSDNITVALARIAALPRPVAQRSLTDTDVGVDPDEAADDLNDHVFAATDALEVAAQMDPFEQDPDAVPDPATVPAAQPVPAHHSAPTPAPQSDLTRSATPDPEFVPVS